MKTVNILLVEDNANVRAGIVDTLEDEGYGVIPAEDGEAALYLFGQKRIDLVLLDLMLPGVNGYDTCRQLRMKNETVPIIMLTAKSEQADKVLGLQLGADDYITKPFGVPELLARIAAVLRRSRNAVAASQKKLSTPIRFKFGPADVNIDHYQSTVNGHVFDLTPREIKLIQKFYMNPNKVLCRDEILNDVWGMAYLGTTRTLDQHIAQLRKKIEPDASNPVALVTIHGAGYKFVK